MQIVVWTTSIYFLVGADELTASLNGTKLACLKMKSSLKIFIVVHVNAFCTHYLHYLSVYIDFYDHLQAQTATAAASCGISGAAWRTPARNIFCWDNCVMWNCQWCKFLQNSICIKHNQLSNLSLNEQSMTGKMFIAHNLFTESHFEMFKLSL